MCRTFRDIADGQTVIIIRTAQEESLLHRYAYATQSC